MSRRRTHVVTACEGDALCPSYGAWRNTYLEQAILEIDSHGLRSRF
jgi:hypothetical protein